MTVLITLTTAGADTGPFDLYSDVDGYLVPFETNVPKASLVSGYTSVLVPGGATIIRVMSDSICTNYIDLVIGATTTTTSSTSTSTSTSTTTSTTTAVVMGTLYGLYGYADITGDACTQSGTYVSLGSPELAVYATSTTPGGVTEFFNDMGLTPPHYDNPAVYNKYVLYSLASDPTNFYVGFYNGAGFISGQTDCV